MTIETSRARAHAAAPAPDSGASYGEAPSPARHRILVVDDNRDSADTLALLLEMLGHETRAVHDGAGALDAAAAFRPHMVLLDIGLPDLSGYEVCRRLRETEWGRAMRMVALTGRGGDEDQRRSREAGFDAHLVKPVQVDTVQALLESSPPGA